MPDPTFDPFHTKSTLNTASGNVAYYSLPKLEETGIGDISKLPFSIKVLLESVLRNCDGNLIPESAVETLAKWSPAAQGAKEIPFKPARVLLQDFTGVPALVDLAAMRTAMADMGGDAQKIEPLIPSELVIDHSVQVDYFAIREALKRNMEIEFQRNRERYEFLKWGQKAFKKFTVIPPGVGIVHQINLEYFARGVFLSKNNGEQVAYPDSLVGTDSHTTMINALGIVGWGVGGIEAEAVMLGQPIFMLTPEVIGFELVGQLPSGATATDLVLTVTQMLRKQGVVGKFVEFYGTGLSNLTLPDRAVISNMSPEYGATIGFFPIDEESLSYLHRTGRSEERIDLVRQYTAAQGLFRTDDVEPPEFTDTLHLDLGDVRPSLAGPKRPQDKIALEDMDTAFQDSLVKPAKERGFELSADQLENTAPVEYDGQSENLSHGSLVIAAITSCTNTSNPSLMLGAALLAKNAVEKGLSVPSYVKTSLAPGSRVVTDYLQRTNLTDYLDKLGFQTVGYGCTTCIGNSGPLPDNVSKAIEQGKLVVASVLSGNRNFEGRINPLTKANYLASPALVVAFALAGRIDIDLSSEPLGEDTDGNPVYLKDIWPSMDEIKSLLDAASDPKLYTESYKDVNSFNPDWNKVPVPESDIYEWKDDSTYIQHPPFFKNLSPQPEPIQSIQSARVLALLGDSVTTDHISPAGAIPSDSPAADYLRSKGVEKKDFNSFGSRRGNDQVMVRGTFGNIRLTNFLAPGTEGGLTVHLPDGEQMWIYDAAMKYADENTPLVVLAGKEYGTGSSRDWAAKGTMMLGVKAVIAQSYERIHRSNLVGMGVLPLQFKDGESVDTLGLTGKEKFSISLSDDIQPLQEVDVTAVSDDGTETTLTVTARLDTPVDITYYRNGGILHTVLRDMANGSK